MQKLSKALIALVLILILLPAGIAGIAYYAAKKLSDETFLKSIFYKKYGLVLGLEEIHAGYSGLSFAVESPYISIGGGNSAVPFIDVKDFSIRLKILPMLLRKISVSELSAKEVSVNLKREEDGSIDFLKYIKFNNSSLFSLDLSGAQVSIPEYSLTFNDKFVKNNFLLQGHSFTSHGLDINSDFSLATNGSLTIGNHNSHYFIDVDYTKYNGALKLKKHEILLYALDLSFLKKYSACIGFSNLDIKLDVYSTAQDGFFKTYFYLDNINAEFNYKGDKNTVISTAPLIMETVFTAADENLIIKSGRITGDKIDIFYSGRIKNAFDLKEIEPELEISVSNSSIGEILKITPDTLLPFQEPYVKNLKLYKINAIVNGSARVRYKNNEDFSVDGKLTFDDVYINTPPENAKTSFGECEFAGRDVWIEVYANTPNDALLTVFGNSRLQKLPDCEFDIKSYGQIDMEFAQTILNPVQKILALKLGPLPYMKLNGHGEILLHTKGNKEKADLNGFFATNDATVGLEGLNAVLNNGSAKILFEGTDIIYNGVKGIINGVPAQINGTSNTSGDLNMDVFVKDISAKDVMYIAQTSPIVLDALDGGAFLKSFKPHNGNIDFYLNLSGNVPPDAVLGRLTDSILAKGNIIFKGVDLTVNPQIKGNNVKGKLDFGNSASFDLAANIFNSPFQIEGTVEQKGAKGRFLKGVPSVLSVRFVSDKVASNSIGNFILDNIELFAPKDRFFAINLAKVFNTNEFLANADILAKGTVYPDCAELDLSGYDFDGEVKGINYSGSDFIFKGGNIHLKGKNAKFNKLAMSGAGIDFVIDGNIDKFVSNRPFNNLKLVFYKSTFESYKEVFRKILPEKSREIISRLKHFKGNVSGNVKIYGDKISGEFIPHGVSFFDTKSLAKIHLSDGKMRLKNEKTFFDAVTIDYGGLPIYFDGFVQTDGDKNPEFNIYFSTNLSEENCDKLINPHLEYPVLIVGEAQVKGRVLGRPDAYTSYLTVILNKGSDISFIGLKLGDIGNKREAAFKIKFKGYHANIDYIRYFKYVASQNNKQTPYDLIKISGGLNLKNGEFLLDNLHFVTPNPAPVRFLNPVFKKSIIKDGLFNSDLVLNGSLADISAAGTLELSNVIIPMYDSIIDNIKINLQKQKGKAEFSLIFFDTKADITLDFVNKAVLPVIINNVAVHSGEVLINNLMNALAAFADSVSKTSKAGVSSVLTTAISPFDIQIKTGSLTVDKILFNGVEGSGLKLNFSHSVDTSLKIDNASLAIAGGQIKGSGTYKFNTKDVFVNSDFINCDANELTKAFFNLQGQIYGNANGKFTLSMKDFTPNDYVNKVNADAEFEILNGRMPKLGSIEYLLWASNFFKSGIFGLTINNVIEFLTPYKHGNFNKISGTFKIGEASINDLKIYSQGENLSTYTYGSYDIPAGTADIEILGRLSKNISNLLGSVGNASVVSVLNFITKNKMDELVKTEALKNVSKIPLMDLNNDEFKLFNVKLKGEISTDDVVKSFNWLN